jgi:SAM-dependent methyltransferase
MNTVWMPAFAGMTEVRMTKPEPFTFDSQGEARRSAPHVERTAGPICAVLRDILPKEGLVLEIASGTGEHALHFARAFPHLLFQPTDADPVALRSVEAWRTGEGAPNLLAPVPLDAASDRWPVDEAAAILCINMVHISPWEATLGLLKGAGRLLPPGGPLYLYGAYRQRDVETAPSNEAFDRSLKERNPAWGLRLLEEVADAAAAEGLRLESVTPMPANNLSVVFRRL